MAPRCEANGNSLSQVNFEDFTEQDVKTPLKWNSIIYFSLIHLGSVYALFLVPSAQYKTIIFGYILLIIGMLSVTAGAHRLWSHRSYKARTPLRVMLMLFNFIAAQKDLIHWCRNHRVHHKYSETTADPHNAKRGFFFAHVGWLLYRKHPDVIKRGKQLDFRDLYADPVLRFQRKYYFPLVIPICLVLPAVVPCYFWDESLTHGFFIATVLRYCVSLNCTWIVNSAAHIWGMKPYDKNINPAENMLVSLGAIGEGFHNYHHTFPQDYATSEFGMLLNPTTMFINLMAKIGWAYDLKTTPTDIIEARKLRTGCYNHITSLNDDSNIKAGKTD